MKRLIIICEGQTEQEFCKDVLYPHFLGKETLIAFPTIKKSKGGIVNWNILKKEIKNHLSTNKNAFVTTLIDYYGIQDKHEFPNWHQRLKIINKQDRMSFLEGAMKEGIDEDELRFRFLPYLQLHEFEGLLFSDLTVFQQNFDKSEFTNFSILEQAIIQFPNPEEINENKTTAPSKRLDSAIKGYNKVVHGAILAKEIGLHKIRNKCPRFNQWITNLENL